MKYIIPIVCIKRYYIRKKNKKKCTDCSDKIGIDAKTFFSKWKNIRLKHSRPWRKNTVKMAHTYAFCKKDGSFTMIKEASRDPDPFLSAVSARRGAFALPELPPHAATWCNSPNLSESSSSDEMTSEGDDDVLFIEQVTPPPSKTIEKEGGLQRMDSGLGDEVDLPMIPLPEIAVDEVAAALQEMEAGGNENENENREQLPTRAEERKRKAQESINNLVEQVNWEGNRAQVVIKDAKRTRAITQGASQGNVYLFLDPADLNIRNSFIFQSRLGSNLGEKVRLLPTPNYDYEWDKNCPEGLVALPWRLLSEKETLAVADETTPYLFKRLLLKEHDWRVVENYLLPDTIRNPPRMVTYLAIIRSLRRVVEEETDEVRHQREEEQVRIGAAQLNGDVEGRGGSEVHHAEDGKIFVPKEFMRALTSQEEAIDIFQERGRKEALLQIREY